MVEGYRLLLRGAWGQAGGTEGRSIFIGWEQWQPGSDKHSLSKCTKRLLQEGAVCQTSFSEEGLTAWMATRGSSLQSTTLHVPLPTTPTHSFLLSTADCHLPKHMQYPEHNVEALLHVLK